jgi:4-hydroxy-3-polyprenylbenzoate decarboxylase
MMFNKILVITDEPADIRDYGQLARYVFRHWNPATDVYFSQGPMDVLDHSCSKLGFGGKMCIDGTGKTEEEREAGYSQTPIVPVGLTAAALVQRWPEIITVNLSLVAQQIPCLVLAVKKDHPDHIRELHEAICGLRETEGVKMILYVEHTVDAADLSVALWRFCNNLDPRRDHLLVRRKSLTDRQQEIACLGLDGTRKTKGFDNFQRDWPNIIVAADATIRAVDEKWAALGIGAFLPSPSLKFKDQVYGEEAVVDDAAGDKTGKTNQPYGGEAVVS